MYADCIGVTDFRDPKDLKGYRVRINSYWVEIKDKAGDIVFERRATDDNWMDKTHQKIVKGIVLLEESLFAAIVEVKK